MDVSNDDSDDSAFLFLPTSLKRKAPKENSQKTKQVRLSNDGGNESLPKEECATSPICIQISSGSSTESKDKETNLDAEEKSGFLETLKDVKKKITATCPLCLKVFENSNSHISHMKQCAKKRKMTTQQLLSALELQKKQMEERRALGLSSQVPVSEVKKTNAARKKVQSDVDPESNFQLALALAMSKSLEEHNNSKACSSQMDPDKDNVIEAQKTTLEKFGFTSSSGAGVQVAGKKKWKRSGRSILRERTKEDREKIISEKASEVLLDEDVIVDVPNKKGEEFLDSLELLKYKNEGKRLWNNGEDEKVETYYVEDIKDKLNVQEGNSPKLTQFVDVLSCGSSIQSQDIQTEIFKLNLPKSSFSQSWEKMVNNQEFSDVTVRTKDDKTVYLHSLVLHVRNPEILSKNYKSIFENFNFLTVISFVEFLYCGILNRNLPKAEVENLFHLAETADFKDLINVLNILKDNLKLTLESSEGIIPPSPEVSIITGPREPSAEKDWPMDDMVDLTQSSRDSPVEENPEGEASEDESNLEKSYWSFMEHERRKKELEELRKQEEEKENIINSNELYKIDEIMKKQKEFNQSLLEEEEENYKNKLELEKIYGLNLNDNNDEEKDIFDEEPPKNRDEEDIFQTPKKKIDKSVIKNEDYIVLSSDSNDEENTERLFKKSKPVIDLDYDIPQFDPYDNYNDISFNVTESDVKNNIQSQSLVTGSFSPISSRPPMSLRRSLEETPKDMNVTREQIVEETPMRLEKPEFFSTPISNDKTLKCSTSKKSGKRKTDLSSNRILRNSLRLSVKSRMLKTNVTNRRSVRRSLSEKQKKKKLEESVQMAEILTKSVLNEFNNSMAGSSKTPRETRSNRNYLEVTPKTKNMEYSEKVTPMPDYSVMQASTLKKHLSKYGLKKSLAKSKAKKILRHIYEELHPVLNTETGKIVKYLPEEKPKSKRSKKTNPPSQKPKPASKKSSPAKKCPETPKKNQETPKKNSPTPEKINEVDSDASVDSMNKSTDCDSDGSEYDLEEPLTQSTPASTVDLPTAFSDFMKNNPEYHRQILLYEPIWLEELQNLLFVNFNKKFKLSDLMDFLDKQCITFRSEAQKKSNEKRNEKKKASPKKKQKSPKKSTKSGSSFNFDDG